METEPLQTTEQPQENKKKKRGLWILFLFFVLVALAAFVALLFHWILPLVPTDEPIPPTTETTTTQATEPTQPTVPLVDNPIDFAALKAQNEDIVGWICVPGTVIDYPVMRSSGEEDNDFYLHRDIHKDYLFSGCIYMQKYNSGNFTDPNTVLYGHNMANGSMFAAIRWFRRESFFNENQYIYVYAPGHIYKYHIYSAFMYDNRHILNSFDFYNEKEYAEYLAMTQDPRSMVRQVRSDVSVTTADRIITLSTCDSWNQRFLVEGVLVDDQLTY